MALFRKKETKENQATPAAVEQVPTQTTEKVDDAEEDVPEGLRPVATTATEDIVYPSGLRLALLLSSVFMSMFLVSLVGSQTWLPSLCAALTLPHSLCLRAGGLRVRLRATRVSLLTRRDLGSSHHLNRHSTDHRRLSLRDGHRLVWQCLPADQLLIPAPVRQDLHLLQHQSRFPVRRVPLRGRIRHMRCGAQLDLLHRRPCHRRLGFLRYHVRCGMFASPFLPSYPPFCFSVLYHVPRDAPFHAKSQQKKLT